MFCVLIPNTVLTCIITTTKTAATHQVCNPAGVMLSTKSHVRDVQGQLLARVGLESFLLASPH